MRISGWTRTLYIFAGYIFIVFIHSYILALGETRKACIDGQPLYDVAHELAARGHWFFSNLRFISHDFIVFGLISCLIFLIARHPQGQVLLRRYFVFHTAMSVIRALLIFVTTIPNPNGACSGRFLVDAEVFSRSIGLTLSVIGIPYDWHNIGIQGDTCCDMIISGHTSMLVILCMVISMGLRSRRLKIGLWILSSIGLAGVITVDRHYTVDMLVTVIIAALMISLYQMKVANSGRLIGYFEQKEKFGDVIIELPISSLLKKP